jgi:hypothetical protein
MANDNAFDSPTSIRYEVLDALPIQDQRSALRMLIRNAALKQA